MALRLVDYSDSSEESENEQDLSSNFDSSDDEWDITDISKNGSNVLPTAPIPIPLKEKDHEDGEEEEIESYSFESSQGRPSDLNIEPDCEPPDLAFYMSSVGNSTHSFPTTAYFDSTAAELEDFADFSQENVVIGSRKDPTDTKPSEINEKQINGQTQNEVEKEILEKRGSQVLKDSTLRNKKRRGSKEVSPNVNDNVFQWDEDDDPIPTTSRLSMEELKVYNVPVSTKVEPVPQVEEFLNQLDDDQDEDDDSESSANKDFNNRSDIAEHFVFKRNISIDTQPSGKNSIQSIPITPEEMRKSAVHMENKNGFDRDVDMMEGDREKGFEETNNQHQPSYRKFEVFHTNGSSTDLNSPVDDVDASVPISFVPNESTRVNLNKNESSVYSNDVDNHSSYVPSVPHENFGTDYNNAKSRKINKTSSDQNPSNGYGRPPAPQPPVSQFINQYTDTSAKEVDGLMDNVGNCSRDHNHFNFGYPSTASTSNVAACDTTPSVIGMTVDTNIFPPSDSAQPENAFTYGVFPMGTANTRRPRSHTTRPSGASLAGNGRRRKITSVPSTGPVINPTFDRSTSTPASTHHENSSHNGNNSGAQWIPKPNDHEGSNHGNNNFATFQFGGRSTSLPYDQLNSTSEPRKPKLRTSQTMSVSPTFEQPKFEFGVSKEALRKPFQFGNTQAPKDFVFCPPVKSNLSSSGNSTGKWASNNPLSPLSKQSNPDLSSSSSSIHIPSNPRPRPRTRMHKIRTTRPRPAPPQPIKAPVFVNFRPNPPQPPQQPTPTFSFITSNDIPRSRAPSDSSSDSPPGIAGLGLNDDSEEEENNLREIKRERSRTNILEKKQKKSLYADEPIYKRKNEYTLPKQVASQPPSTVDSPFKPTWVSKTSPQRMQTPSPPSSSLRVKIPIVKSPPSSQTPLQQTRNPSTPSNQRYAPNSPSVARSVPNSPSFLRAFPSSPATPNRYPGHVRRPSDDGLFSWDITNPGVGLDERDRDWGELKRLGGLAYASKRYVEASEYYRQSIEAVENLIELFPEIKDEQLLKDKAKLHSNRAASLMMLMQIQEAQRECNRAIEVDSSYTIAYLRLARIQILMGDTDQAKESVKAVKKLLDSPGRLRNGEMTGDANSLSPEQYVHRQARELQARDDDLAAVAKINDSIQKLETLELEIRWCLELKEYPRALGHLDDALGVAPRSRSLQVQKANTIFLQKNYSHVVSYCNELLRKQKFLSTPGNRAGSNVMMARAQQELRYLGVDLSLLRIKALHYQNKLEEAQQMLVALERVAPCSSKVIVLRREWERMKALKHRGNDCFKKGEFSAAILFYNDALEVDPEHDEFCAVIHCNRAAALMGLDRYEEALVQCNEALRRKPIYPRGRLRRARCYVGLKKFEESLIDFDHYLSEHQGDASSGSIVDVRLERAQAEESMRNIKRREEMRRREESARARHEQATAGARTRTWSGNAYPDFDSPYYDDPFSWQTDRSGDNRTHRTPRSNNNSTPNGGRTNTTPNSRNRSPKRDPNNHHYATLGVSKKATQAEIRQAYRRLALQYHPDKSNEKEHVELFKEMTAAYTIISDVNKRATYDRELLLRGIM